MTYACAAIDCFDVNIRPHPNGCTFREKRCTFREKFCAARCDFKSMADSAAVDAGPAHQITLALLTELYGHFVKPAAVFEPASVGRSRADKPAFVQTLENRFIRASGVSERGFVVDVVIVCMRCGDVCAGHGAG